MNTTFSITEIDEIAQKIITHYKEKMLLFYGVMGAGKTTLIKAIGKQLEVIDTINSPTFSIVNEYKTKGNTKVYHFDFFRIKNEQEALDIGIEDYFYNHDYCLIEWPEKIKNLIPSEALCFHLKINANGTRTIFVSNYD